MKQSIRKRGAVPFVLQRPALLSEALAPMTFERFSGRNGFVYSGGCTLFPHSVFDDVAVNLIQTVELGDVSAFHGSNSESMLLANDIDAVRPPMAFHIQVVQ